MAHTHGAHPPKPALDVTIAVRWPAGERVFHTAITHEAILARAAGDALLAASMQDKIKVPFAHWRRLEVQLAHVWSSGQAQVIYSHATTEDNRSTHEQVIELLAWWQQLACLEPRSVRMHLALEIDPAGAPLLPPRHRLLSLTARPAELQPRPDAQPHEESPPNMPRPRPRPPSALEPHRQPPDCQRQPPDCQRQPPDCQRQPPDHQQAQDAATDGDPRVGTHVTFDRAHGMWTRIHFTRAESFTRPRSSGDKHD
jgi:hypothetical protein